MPLLSILFFPADCRVLCLSFFFKFMSRVCLQIHKMDPEFEPFMLPEDARSAGSVFDVLFPLPIFLHNSWSPCILLCALS